MKDALLRYVVQFKENDKKDRYISLYYDLVLVFVDSFISILFCSILFSRDSYNSRSCFLKMTINNNRFRFCHENSSVWYWCYWIQGHNFCCIYGTFNIVSSDKPLDDTLSVLYAQCVSQSSNAVLL